MLKKNQKRLTILKEVIEDDETQELMLKNLLGNDSTRARKCSAEEEPEKAIYLLRSK